MLIRSGCLSLQPNEDLRSHKHGGLATRVHFSMDATSREHRSLTRGQGQQHRFGVVLLEKHRVQGWFRNVTMSPSIPGEKAKGYEWARMKRRLTAVDRQIVFGSTADNEHVL